MRVRLAAVVQRISRNPQVRNEKIACSYLHPEMSIDRIWIFEGLHPLYSVRREVRSIDSDGYNPSNRKVVAE